MEIRIREKKSVYFLQILFGLLGGLLFYFFLLDSGFFEEEFEVPFLYFICFIFGGIGILLCFAFLDGIFRLLYPKEGLIINKEGISCKTNGQSIHTIHWKEIKDLQINGENILSIEFVSAQNHTKRLNISLRFFIFIYNKTYQGNPKNVLDIRLEDLVIRDMEIFHVDIEKIKSIYLNKENSKHLKTEIKKNI